MQTERRARLCVFAAGVALLAGCSAPAPRAPAAYDVLITGGTLYDGSGAPGRIANVAIAGSRIVSVAAPADACAGRVIDATGHIVVPGFIDPHTHARKDLSSAERNANLNYQLQGVTTVVIGNDGDGVPNRQARFEHMMRAGIGTSVAFFAGHGHIRRNAMGLAEREPGTAELDAMRAAVRAAMRDGALGLSSGLYYVPGTYANTDEVVALARVAAETGGVYDTHLRSEGSYSIGLLAAVEEAIEVGRGARIGVHISHIKALGSDVWGQSRDVIARVDAARAEGIDVTANQYPFRASGTRFSNALIPRWVMADSKDAMRARLADPALHERIDAEMRANLVRRGGPDAMLVSAADNEFRGLTLADIARRRGVPPLVAAIDLVLDGDPSIASFVMTDEDIDALAVQDWVMTGSDGSAGHPRKYATYPKAYRDLVAGRKLMDTARFVRRGTGLVADTLGLCDRGYLRVGLRADIAVIDLDRFEPQATYEDPARYSTGVKTLLIGGVETIADGEWNGALAGAVVRRNLLECP